MQNEVLVYTLTNPLSGLVYYVGITSNGLHYRLNGHLHAKSSVPTTKHLKELGIVPIIEEIDTCCNLDEEDVEQFWVDQFKAWGFKIENRMTRSNWSVRNVNKYDLLGNQRIKK